MSKREKFKALSTKKPFAPIETPSFWKPIPICQHKVFSGPGISSVFPSEFTEKEIILVLCINRCTIDHLCPPKIFCNDFFFNNHYIMNHGGGGGPQPPPPPSRFFFCYNFISYCLLFLFLLFFTPTVTYRSEASIERDPLLLFRKRIQNFCKATQYTIQTSNIQDSDPSQIQIMVKTISPIS